MIGRDIEYEGIKKSISLTKKITKNMYLYDVQFKIWRSRVRTNTRLYKIKITESEFCDEPETIEHAFIWCELYMVWSDLRLWLYTLVYYNFRLEHKIIILGDEQKD